MRSSGSQSPMWNWCEVTRVPGFIARISGRSLRLRSGSRYIVTTVAREKFSTKMSPVMMFTRPSTPARRTLRRASSAMSALYSMPTAVAPKYFAAAIGILPSPRPEVVHEVVLGDLGRRRASSSPARRASAPTRRPCPAARRSAGRSRPRARAWPARRRRWRSRRRASPRGDGHGPASSKTPIGREGGRGNEARTGPRAARSAEAARTGRGSGRTYQNWYQGLVPAPLPSSPPTSTPR